jgi:hypothetical protein
LLSPPRFFSRAVGPSNKTKQTPNTTYYVQTEENERSQHNHGISEQPFLLKSRENNKTMSNNNLNELGEQELREYLTQYLQQREHGGGNPGPNAA